MMRLPASRASMDPGPSRGEDEHLSDALASLLRRLRAQPYGGLDDEAERLVGSLAKHLRFSEDILFPVLRELEPGSEGDLAELERDHRLMHLYARDLGLLIRDGDREGAYGIARSFLAVLLDHLHREVEEVDGWVRSLDDSDARRFSTALTERHRPAGETGDPGDAPR